MMAAGSEYVCSGYGILGSRRAAGIVGQAPFGGGRGMTRCCKWKVHRQMYAARIGCTDVSFDLYRAR